jgi:nucleoside-diphosphate kinase
LRPEGLEVRKFADQKLKVLHSTKKQIQRKNSAHNIRYSSPNYIRYSSPNYIQKNYMSTLTFTMIKPDAVRAGNIGNILAMINQAGFRIVAMKYLKLSEQQAGQFYAVHAHRPFYSELVAFMSSGPIVAAVLEKEDAVASYRAHIGATNPADAAEGTIRKRYAASVGENAVHGSDSDENAQIEANFFFSSLERY